MNLDSIFHPEQAVAHRRGTARHGLIILFGSGEMSPTGRKIHEAVIKRSGLSTPLSVGILETPTGFEVNAVHGWPERMENFFAKSLKNVKPIVERIHAWRRDGPHSTNDPAIVDMILSQDYLYCGAGSPGYTVKHLKDTRAYQNLCQAHTQGAVLCLGSATAVAISRFAIPVYEIFKVGADLHWLDGLNFFAQYGLNLIVVPHWNNQEGEDFDTTRCWMGKERFHQLLKLLPVSVTIVGIDEQTACLFDVNRRTVEVLGVGSVWIRKRNVEKQCTAGSAFSFSEME